MERQVANLQKALEAITGPLPYGSVKITMKEGKPILVSIERTVKLA